MKDYDIVVQDSRSQKTQKEKPLKIDQFENFMIEVMTCLDRTCESYDSDGERSDFLKSATVSIVVTILHNYVKKGHRLEELEEVYIGAKKVLLKYEVMPNANYA
jgi:hypothetical protein